MNRRQFIISLAMAGIWPGMQPFHALAKGPGDHDNVIKPARMVDGQRRYKIPAGIIDNEKDACLILPDAQIIVDGEKKKETSPSRCLAQLMHRPVKVQAKEYQTKMRLFNKPHPDDRYVSREQRPLFKNCLKRLNRIYRTVGHTNFYLLGLDDTLKLARGYSRIGRFSKKEIEYLESVFYRDAVDYGFYGKRLITEFTSSPSRSKVKKIPGTGNFLFQGPSVALYERLRQDIGSKTILTSGVRSIIKQFLLFFRKVDKSRGNLSLASRSIAPPGYSYHAVGDFDVGQVGLGSDNFSVRFIRSKVFKKLLSLDYICLRYTEDNPYGVRFEPWHVMTLKSG